jgi:hypothetical protein
MSDGVPPEKQQPEQRLDSWDAVLRYAVTRLIDAIFSEKSPKLVLWVVGLFQGFQILYIYMLPEEARASVESPITETAEAISSVLSSSPMAWLGWVFFVVTLIILVFVTRTLWGRVQSQGHRLKEQRDMRISDRVSSRNEESIDHYDDSMKQKFGDTNDTDND